MHKKMIKLGRGMAILGGLVLSLLILLTGLSVLGRMLNTALHGWIGGLAPGISQWLLDLGVGPILGDFELVESGVAFAIFAFLPLCQLTAGHASVDILTNSFPLRMNRFLIMVSEVLFAAVLVLIAWRLYEGMMSKRSYGETTFLLQFPIWWSYAASLFAAVVAAFAGVYMGVVRIYEFLTNHNVIHDGAEAEL